MEGFKYVDLYATKGAEYLLVIGFLLALVLFWRYLNHPARGARTVGSPPGTLATLNRWFHLVEGLFYHQGHSWAAPETGNVVRVGIDDFAQKLLGKPNAVDLPRCGARLEQGESGWKLQIDSKSIDMLSPVDGEVLAVMRRS